MNVSLLRIILYVADVRRLAEFYGRAFGLPVVEEIEDEWAVLQAGHCQLALHRAGEGFRIVDATAARQNKNAKIVMAVHGDLKTLREKLVSLGVVMNEIKSYAGITGLHCDGIDPEGNVFQIAQA